jgi:hypothetical protein
VEPLDLTLLICVRSHWSHVVQSCGPSLGYRALETVSFGLVSFFEILGSLSFIIYLI